MSWFVLSVKEKQEDKVAKMLEKMDFEVFNPLVKEIKFWSNKQKIVETPLFKSHIFVNIPEPYRGVVFALPDVKGYMFIDGKPAKVYKEEVDTIKGWLENGSHDLVLLSKLISRKEIHLKNWLSKNNAGVKWIGEQNVTTLIKEMNVIVERKLRKVV
ncbi:UpxY family transcription antiterminator [Neotamlana nanhaiensis]|uniref:UpxY family transcription antiterminator n=1 Tax=Neotamlana nanhaiensis TaxID=1382798 RepID=UPI000B000B52|nr:UpxY family transcription antiterminator [Tamlana nanhaiensis]